MAIDTFDFVIAGGGIAGLVLATRLSEDPNVRVAVIEAGEDKSADSRFFVPGLWPTWAGSEGDWAFQIKDQVCRIGP